MSSTAVANSSAGVDLSMRTAAVPLPLGLVKGLMNAREDEFEDVSEDAAENGEEEAEEDDVQSKVQKARTIYHSPNGDNDTVNSTRSLWDADVEYTMIHGRRYCGNYYIPNDEEEQCRQQMLDGVYLHILNDELTTVPLLNPRKILDVGCGTGEWVMGMAEMFPDCEVIGTDIAHIQPTSVTINVFFEIDDAEGEGGWTWQGNVFDMVHFRSMAGAFESWEFMYDEAFKHLKPGGWIEVLDFDNHGKILSYFKPDSAIHSFLDAVNDAMKDSGRDRSANHMTTQSLIDAGFVNTKLVEMDIPIGIWPEDKKEKSMAKVFLVAQLCAVESRCLRPLIERGWDIEEIRRLCSDVTEELRTLCMDPVQGHGMSFKLRILTGRKPNPMELDVPDGSSIISEISIKTVTGL